jgi:hypothetical protein
MPIIERSSDNPRGGRRLSPQDFKDLREDIASAHSAMGDMLHSSERESREHAVRAFNYLGAVVACLLDHADYVTPTREEA